MSLTMLTRDQMREYCKIFDHEVKSDITEFRHKTEQEQNDFCNDILTKTIKVIQHLKQLQSQDKIDKLYQFKGDSK